MKKFFVGLMTFFMAAVFLLSGCKKDQSNPDPNPNPNPDPDPTDPEKFELEIEVEKGANLKVAQWTDLHYGDPQKPYHNGKEELTKKYLEYYKENGKPDFIVCGGDNILSTGDAGLTKFIRLMDSFQTPWTFVFGNHDAEDAKTKGVLSKKLEEHSKDSDYLMYRSGFVDEDDFRYGNFSIAVREKDSDTIRGAFVFLDSGIYDYSAAKYQSVTDEQVDWYKKEIDKLQEAYVDGSVVPTVLFQHMQTPEFYTAYKDAKEGKEDAQFVIEEDLTEAEIEEIKNGAATEDAGILDACIEKKSTKAIIVGHAHNYGFQVNYKGVILGFGPQTGHSNTFKNDDLPRRSYLYTFDKDFKFTTEAINEPLLTIDKTSGSIYVDDTFEAKLTLSNMEGTLTASVDEEGIVEINQEELKNNILFVTGKKAGKVNVTITGPNDTKVTVEIEVKAVNTFNAYREDGTLLGNFRSVYEALDELYVLGQLNGTIKVVSNGEEADVVYGGTNGKSYAWFDENGLSDAFDSTGKVTNGQFSWYQNYESDLKIHTQGLASMMFQASGNEKNIGKFFARPADFETTNTDGSGGYHPSGDPDGMWTGWRASVYKAGVTTAQYLSWADNSGGYDKMQAVYDLTSSTISPSKNPNQPVRAEIWLGAQNNADASGASAKYSHVIMGISFDAGTVESTKDLADGTKRDIKLFSEVVALNGGMAEAYMGERVYGDTVGYATWDKANGVWKFDSKYDISLVFTNVESKGLFTLTVNKKVLTFDFGYEVLFTGNLRLTYGVSLTPDTYQNNRKVPDLKNGSKWLNVVQESFVKTFTTKDEPANMGFMDGRISNGANQIGIFGGDVCDVVKDGQGHAVFTFKY